MPNFEDGVKRFITARATVVVKFPVDYKNNEYICCDQCGFFRRSYKTCGLNGCICEFSNRYVGSHCPLELETDQNGEI